MFTALALSCGPLRSVSFPSPATVAYSGPVAAPDFTLIDQAGEPWTLSDHRGKGVVLLFLRGDW